MIIDLPIEIIELEDDSYHLMMEAEFADGISGSLIIDTGASKTVFDMQFVEPFITDVEDVEEQNSSGINAMINQAKVGVIPEISFGKFKIEDYQCMLLDLSHINELYKKYTNKHIAGLVGSDFLVKYDAIIDYGRKVMTLDY